MPCFQNKHVFIGSEVKNLITSEGGLSCRIMLRDGCDLCMMRQQTAWPPPLPTSRGCSHTSTLLKQPTVAGKRRHAPRPKRFILAATPQIQAAPMSFLTPKKLAPGEFKRRTCVPRAQLSYFRDQIIFQSAAAGAVRAAGRLVYTKERPSAQHFAAPSTGPRPPLDILSPAASPDDLAASPVDSETLASRRRGRELSRAVVREYSPFFRGRRIQCWAPKLRPSAGSGGHGRSARALDTARERSLSRL